MPKTPLLVLITGGIASGKTTLVKKIKEHFEQTQRELVTISTDSYYAYSFSLFYQKNPNLQEIFKEEELNKDLESLLKKESIYLPTYDSNKRQFTRSSVLVNSAPVIIVEGIFTLFSEKIRKKADLKIYLEVDEYFRLAKRLERNSKEIEEGNKFHEFVEQEEKRHDYVKKNHEVYVESTRKYADSVVNNNKFEGNVEKIVELINEKLQSRSEQSILDCSLKVWQDSAKEILIKK